MGKLQPTLATTLNQCEYTLCTRTAKQRYTVWICQIPQSIIQYYIEYFSEEFHIWVIFKLVFFGLLFFGYWLTQLSLFPDNLEDHTGPSPTPQLEKKSKLWIFTWKKKLKFSGLFSLPLVCFFSIDSVHSELTCCPFLPSLMCLLHNTKTLSPLVSLARLHSISCPSLKVPQITYLPIFIYNRRLQWSYLT